MKILLIKKYSSPFLYFLTVVDLIVLTLWTSSRVYSFTFLPIVFIFGLLLFSAANMALSRFEGLTAPKLFDHFRQSFFCYALLFYILILISSNFFNFLHQIHDTECIRVSHDGPFACAWDLKGVYFSSVVMLAALEAILLNVYYLLMKPPYAKRILHHH